MNVQQMGNIPGNPPRHQKINHEQHGGEQAEEISRLTQLAASLVEQPVRPAQDQSQRYVGIPRYPPFVEKTFKESKENRIDGKDKGRTCYVGLLQSYDPSLEVKTEKKSGDQQQEKPGNPLLPKVLLQGF
ncbi:hypothetical protein ES708_27358 [subsurface metagenome]